ncbi:discoidin domain-containing protein [Paenibacillus sp. ov031]|uniref:discoidin domain-containing protein n=1 Tax=Paenibacillus sp. ov031 TaxID=1761879 RepID=UPI001FCCEA26|nr:discoidin domain-containing protein [Paenibacillus sp. ov031]
MLVTWDKVNIGTGVVLSNGDLTALTPALDKNALSSLVRNTGKIYTEITVVSGIYFMIGIVPATHLAGNRLWSYQITGLYGYTGNFFRSQASFPYGVNYGVGDTISILIDCDNNELEFWKNGVSQGKVSSINSKLSLSNGVKIGVGSNGGSASYTANFGATPFKYNLPSGYIPYNSFYSDKFLISSEDKYYSVTQYPESDDIIPALTSNVTVLGSVIRSDENASYPAWQAFDKKTITSDHQFAWISATMMSGWIGFDFNSPIIIDRYTITGRSDANYTMSPKDWTFEGSNDGTNWTVLDTRRNVIDWNTTQTRSFIIGNKAKYKMYRINAVNNNSSNGVLIKEIKMGCSNQGAYLKNVKLNNAETAYLSHGMSKSESIGLDISFSTRIFVNPTSITLGSGKVFKQKIDTAKIPIKKASIT